jgi:hypothetical protein
VIVIVVEIFMQMIMVYALAITVNAVKRRELTPMKKIMDMIYLTKTK